MKQFFFQNLHNVVSKANDVGDVISLAKVLHEAIPRREWMPIRAEICKQCSVKATYAMVFVNKPEVLFPKSRKRFAPIIKKILLTYLLQQKQNYEAYVENVNKLLTKIYDFDN